MAELKRRVLNFLIALDQFLHSLFTLGNSDPDETISSALYRAERDGKIAGRLLRPVVDRLFWFDPEHCYTSYLSEINHIRRT